MSRLLPLLLCLTLAGLTSCVSTVGQAGVVEGRKLDLAGPVLVLPTENAQDSQGEPVEASGVQVSAAVRSTLTALGIEVLGGQRHGRVAAASEARKLGCSMLLEPVIVEWRDAGHDWVRGGDRVVLSLRFWDQDGRQLLAWGEEEAEDPSMRSGSEATYRLVGPLATVILERIFLGSDIVGELEVE